MLLHCLLKHCISHNLETLFWAKIMVHIATNPSSKFRIYDSILLIRLLRLTQVTKKFNYFLAKWYFRGLDAKYPRKACVWTLGPQQVALLERAIEPLGSGDWPEEVHHSSALMAVILPPCPVISLSCTVTSWPHDHTAKSPLPWWTVSLGTYPRFPTAALLGYSAQPHLRHTPRHASLCQSSMPTQCFPGFCNVFASPSECSWKKKFERFCWDGLKIMGVNIHL